MREVCGVSCGSGDVITSDNNKYSKTMLVPNKSVTPGIKMSSTPGYLDLSPEKMEKLICQKPIEEYYDVEDQPFARGKYAAVRRCRHRQSGQQFAAKFLKKSRRSADLRPEIIHEVAILDACAGSSRIVRLHQVFESQHEMVLLLELAPGGELQMLLDNDEVPEEVQVKKLMKQILDGLIFLHSINVAHLDLKPQNLVLTGEFPQCEVKLCDLGISRYISDGADIRDILGTPDYVAPEVLNYESISLATDMWSVGVLLYVLLTGCSPFGGDTKQETFCNISQCNLDFPDDLFEEISEDAIDLMKKLMVKEPSKRLDARQCLQHRWFSSNEAIARLGLAKTAASSPLPARKQQQLEACQNVATPRASPKLKHKAPVETTVGDKPSDFRIPEIRVPEIRVPEIRVPEIRVPEIRVPEIRVVSEEVRSESRVSVGGGMKSSRRDNFKRNLSELAQRLSDTNENGGAIEEAKPTTVFLPLEAQRDVSAVATGAGTMRKAKSMHLLPIDGRFDHQRSGNITNAGEVRRRAQVNRDCLYSFRKCIVIDDEDVSPPMSIAGSVTSSVYSDQSISDSGSEVSELSIDSSSDRSSIISLDDSLDYNAKTGRYVATATGHNNNHHNNIWSRQRSSLTINDSFASAFMRFSSGAAGTESKAPSGARRPPARGAHTVVLDRGPQTTVNRPACRVEFRKERFGNVVVIREVRAGKYLQVNELKCESIQARIRRLQVQGIQKT